MLHNSQTLYLIGNWWPNIRKYEILSSFLLILMHISFVLFLPGNVEADVE